MSRLRVVASAPHHAAPVAMSFVHLRRRVDVAPSEVLFVEAEAVHVFICEGQHREFDNPHVAIGLRDTACMRLDAMTRAVLVSPFAERPMLLWVGDRCVTRAVLREPIRSSPFFITASGVEDAREKASFLMRRCASPPLRLVGGTGVHDAASD